MPVSSLPVSWPRAFGMVACLLVVFDLSGGVARAEPRYDQWSVSNSNELNMLTDYELWNGESQMGYLRNASGQDITWRRAAGGHFVFSRETGPRVRDHRRVDPAVNLAIYNTRARRYLRMSGLAGVIWSREPSYEWNLVLQRARSGRVSFAIYNVPASGFLFRDEAGVLVRLTCPVSRECATPHCGGGCP